MMAGNQAELKDETVNDTPGDEEAEVLVKTMADTPKEIMAEALILVPPYISEEADADINQDILVAAMAAAVVDRMNQKLP